MEAKSRTTPVTFENTFREENLIFVRFEYAHRDAGGKLPQKHVIEKIYFGFLKVLYLSV